MAKQPITTEGVTAKMAELYALPDPALKDQASIIQSDFRGWIKNNFTLTTEQLTFLDNVDAGYLNTAGFDASRAAGDRLPIGFQYKHKDIWSSKYLLHETSLTITYNNTLPGYKTTGEVNFEVGYL